MTCGPNRFHWCCPMSEGREVMLPVTVPTPLELVKMRLVVATLEYTGNNVSETARLLGVPRRTLVRWIARWRRPAELKSASAPQAEAGKDSRRPLFATLRVTAMPDDWWNS